MEIINSQNLPRTNYVQWSSIIAGAAVALALSLILVPFGRGIGLSMDAPFTNETVNSLVLKIGVWMFFVQLVSSMLGGYFAGKTLVGLAGVTEHENEFRDGTHGLLAWCVSTIISAAAIALVTYLSTVGTAHSANDIANDPELTKRAAIIFNFGIAASSIVSAVAAWALATIGGDHRNTVRDLSRQVSFRRIKK